MQQTIAGVWLQFLLLAGLAGALGQCARIIVGLKKLNDEAGATGQTFHTMIELPRLFVSLLIGFTAGVLAGVSLHSDAGAALNGSDILAFAAAGYTGADFIEGLMSRYTPNTSSPGYEARSPGATPDSKSNTALG